jgi:hypothetical protein
VVIVAANGVEDVASAVGLAAGFDVFIQEKFNDDDQIFFL